MARKCPNCSTVMVLENAHGVMLDVCPNCAGIWLSADELRALIVGDPQVLAELEASHKSHIELKRSGPSKLLCPDDNILMDHYHYLYDSPILIHSCSKCGGLFVEAEQLPQMQQWHEMSLRPPSKDEEKLIALGADLAEHEAFLLRQQHLLGMFNTLRRYRSGWSGFIP